MQGNKTDARHAALQAAREEAATCERCDLYRLGKQTVFGEGGIDAPIMLVGEQPGYQEDEAGRPFVGPAGKLLGEILDEAGIDRDQVYVTNAVKHFKWVAKGERKIHAKPTLKEVRSCEFWLQREIELVRPTVIVALGATAASTFYKNFKVRDNRGKVFSTRWAKHWMATYHPSALLRAPDEPTRAELRMYLLQDLRRAHELASGDAPERRRTHSAT